MIHYRDMTFCPYTECIKFKDCERAFTEDIKKDAIKWWGSADTPVCYYSTKPDCFKI